MNDKTEQAVANGLRLAAKLAAPYSTALIGASHLNEAADTIDTLRAQLAEAQRDAERKVLPTSEAATNEEFAVSKFASAQDRDNMLLSTIERLRNERSLELTAGDWISAADVDRLAHELDVAMNGKSAAAPQASLCDVVAQAKAEAKKLGRPLLEAAQPPTLPPELVAVADVLRGTAAGGHAEIINVPGYPLMVRAVDYNTLRAQLAEVEKQRDYAIHQAQIWKMEAASQKTTVAECYQICTDATGEPGDWHGAEPVRALKARFAEAQKDEQRLDWLEAQVNKNGELHLHDGNHARGIGIGLRPGTLVRTLRAAIDTAKGEPT